MKNKLYFAKYLPVEEEIKQIKLGTRVKYLLAFGAEGTVTRINGDRAYTDEGIDGNGEFSISEALTNPKSLLEIVGQFKLFLCSRDIQIGDKVLYANSYYEVLDINETGYLVKMSDGKFRLAKGSCEKVIGEISPEAVWVKEGDEFDEEDIEKWLSHADTSMEHEVYKIKGSCGHFH